MIDFCAHCLTNLLYSFLLCTYKWAALGFAGLAGFGSVNKLCIASKIVLTEYAEDHWSFKMSKQIDPSGKTFGWKISVVNFMCGGLFGYSSLNDIFSSNIPPSYGVSSGPQIVACQKYKLFSSIGPLDIPYVFCLWFFSFFSQFFNFEFHFKICFISNSISMKMSRNSS